MEGKAAEWAYGGMTQGARRSLPYPDISPLDGEIHVFPTLKTFLWYLATRVFYTATEYPTKYCILEILSNILYPIEYSYDFTEVTAGYQSVSISLLDVLHITRRYAVYMIPGYDKYVVRTYTCIIVWKKSAES